VPRRVAKNKGARKGQVLPVNVGFADPKKKTEVLHGRSSCVFRKAVIGHGGWQTLQVQAEVLSIVLRSTIDLYVDEIDDQEHFSKGMTFEQSDKNEPWRSARQERSVLFIDSSSNSAGTACLVDLVRRCLSHPATTFLLLLSPPSRLLQN